MRITKIALSNFIAICSVVCATRTTYGQGVDPIVEIPTARSGAALIEVASTPKNVVDTNADDGLTMAGEYKSTKNVVEPEKPICWYWAADIGYTSEYNFRGTNLTPDSDGAGFIQAEVSRWGFTLGLYGIHQFGTARANSFSIGEGGGGGSAAFGRGFFPNPLFPVFGPPLVGAEASVSPETIQDRFNELDVFLSYHRSFGWFDITVGNIGFFIERHAETFVDFTNVALIIPGFGTFPLGDFRNVGPFPSVENEQFDRVYITLSTSKIPHVQPQITYYQTILNDGQQPRVFHLPLSVISPGLPTVPFYRGGERNDELGGYLEGKLKGNFPVTEWLSINPYGVISASFHDRSEPVANPIHVKDAIRGRSLSGFNTAQVGLELPIRLLHMVGTSTGPCAPPDVSLYLVPFAWYSYHISDPTPSTDRNETWGGAKFTLTF